MKKKYSIYIMFFVLTMAITNVKTLSTYKETLPQIKETIMAYTEEAEVETVEIEIQHINKNDNKIIKITNEEIEVNKTIRQSDYKIEVDRFEFIQPDMDEFTVTNDNKIMKLYYQEDEKAEIIINHIDIDTKESDQVIILETSKTTEYIGDMIDTNKYSININGYRYLSQYSEEIEIKPENNVVNLYYKKLDDAKDYIQVYINYYELGTQKKLQETVVDKVEIGTEVYASSYDKNIEGYTFDSYSSEKIIASIDKDNIINIYYTKNSEKNVEVEFIHIDKETNETIKQTKENIKIGTIINSIDYKLDIDGYEYDSSDIKTLTVDENNKTIKLYYNKIEDEPNYYDVYIYYYDRDTKELIEAEILDNVEEFTKINLKDYVKEIQGYHLDMEADQEFIVSKNNTIINYYYKKIPDVKYGNIEIHYIDEDSKEPIEERVSILDVEYGEEIDLTKYIKEIEGYKYLGIDEENIIVDKELSSINIYYEKINTEVPGPDTDDPDVEQPEPDTDDPDVEQPEPDTENPDEGVEPPKTSDDFNIYMFIIIFLASTTLLYINIKKTSKR